MARTALTVSVAAAYGGGVLDIAPATVTHPDGNYFVNTGREKLIIVNGSGSPLTVTIAIPASYRSLQGLVTSKTYTIATTKTAVLGPFEPGLFNQTTGVVNIDYSSGTSVTAAVISHIPAPV